MDTVSAGSSYNAAVLTQGLNGVFNLGQIQNSSYESDGTLVAGLSYVLSEEFDLGNSPTGHPNAGSATSDFLLTFTAVPEPSFAVPAGRHRLRRPASPSTGKAICHINARVPFSCSLLQLE